jgi:hypothetical protein
VVAKTNQNVEAALDALEEMAISISSLTSFQNVDWPYVTLPDYAQTGADTRFLSSSPLIVFSPSVDEADRTGWQAYATENQQWIEDGYEFQRSNLVPTPIPFLLHNETEGSPILLDAPGPFTPVWQMSPAPNVTSIVNFDLRSNLAFKSLEKVVVDTRLWVLSDFINTSTLFGPSAPETEGSPQSVLLQPVFGSGSTSSPRVEAILTSVVFWQVYLQGILPPDIDGIVVVIGDSVGHAATFELYGPTVSFVGNSDLHDPVYSEVVVTAPLACLPLSMMQTDATRETLQTKCDFVLYVYPSASFQAAYTTNHGAVYCTIVVLIVVCTTVAFMLFDWYTRVQEDKLITKAERTHALVASLFPENLHDRLLNADNKKGDNFRLSGKAGLRSFLNDAGGDENELDPEAKPIADL